MQTGCNTNPTS